MYIFFVQRTRKMADKALISQFILHVFFSSLSGNGSSDAERAVRRGETL